ncbi:MULTISPECIES: prepilin-type N-terminal cleavage/methylation domain-containing protein [Brenneria]|uniref:Prepilin-type N-terminal cleavage/methylation domain-containing protein n=1 Tax=Brenneria nigrifluens DSM 30175 = ATCC 13028 TaxID=1121120 RepID=A0A2U1UVQ3_9GAMM|nr:MULTISPECIES: prepilin-type N-terminal cleavage/methylation domain-containing protein [Brenneria]EHD22885.1 putative prepilin peptidase dependent protein c precursor [Brenneria sp. EniD312]PWC25766.1 prepilin-type N-terminal cleavage/methylation domain-containing protein [Brenneria nigrifluens DSM 30175 = ATCC 13028]QCR07006.1 prepilin-type N-terminal cleavage/methylation domain-containing protein [Brenneria nigrifluens DSM 30175 = ATCC 13028]
MRNRALRSRPFQQRGFSLPETLAAALLFAISLLGLLQYHQVLLQSFQHQWQQRQAWRLAAQQLEAYEAGMKYHAMVPPPESGWRFTLSEQAQGAGCRRVTATSTTPRHYQARLIRWFCPAA